MTRILEWLPVAFLVTGAAVACSSVASSGSVYRARCLHVGVRPAGGVADDLSAAVTVQVRSDWPARCP